MNCAARIAPYFVRGSYPFACRVRYPQACCQQLRVRFQRYPRAFKNSRVASAGFAANSTHTHPPTTRAAARASAQPRTAPSPTAVSGSTATVVVMGCSSLPHTLTKAVGLVKPQDVGGPRHDDPPRGIGARWAHDPAEFLVGLVA